MPDYLRLNEMVFYGYHGVLPEERALGQRFIVNVEIQTDLRAAGQSDELARALNYAEVFRAVEKILTGPSRQLLETLAEGVAQAVLEDFRLAEAVAVSIRKPSPPIAGAVLASAEVHIERSRHP